MSALKRIHINQLQRLNDITVDFEPAGVTSIMGANGSGKTTLLQALACVYRKDKGIAIDQDTYAYHEFFKAYEGNDWGGSSYDLQFHASEDVSYSNTAGKWVPRIQNRLVRYVKYISIIDCAPDQEKERSRGIAEFVKGDIGLSASKKRTLLDKVSAALHRQYNDTGLGEKNSGLKRFRYVNAMVQPGVNIEYPSHFMGAGEQKIIHVIHEVLKAPKGSLILIEELDISLHESAIRALVAFLLEQASDTSRQLQIIFTTHWLGIQDFADDLNVISLFEEPATKSVVIREGFDPQFIYTLNGDYNSMRQIRVWVEDGLAAKIIEQVAQDYRYREFVEIKDFGPIQNAYTVAGAVAVAGEKLDRTLVVTDGDCYLQLHEKENQISNSIAGEGERAATWRGEALSIIVDLAAPGQRQPEKVILDLCRELVADNEAPGWLVNNLKWIEQQAPAIDGKVAIYRLSLHSDIGKDRLEGMLVQEASKAGGWHDYTRPFSERLEIAAQAIGLPVREGEAA
jgi:energy-coupling factor transporter ATP-binding protein EcfA2